jgi:hypothetical protein
MSRSSPARRVRALAPELGDDSSREVDVLERRRAVGAGADQEEILRFETVEERRQRLGDRRARAQHVDDHRHSGGPDRGGREGDVDHPARPKLIACRGGQRQNLGADLSIALEASHPKRSPRLAAAMG